MWLLRLAWVVLVGSVAWITLTGWMLTHSGTLRAVGNTYYVGPHWGWFGKVIALPISDGLAFGLVRKKSTPQLKGAVVVPLAGFAFAWASASAMPSVLAYCFDESGCLERFSLILDVLVSFVICGLMLAGFWFGLALATLCRRAKP